MGLSGVLEAIIGLVFIYFLISVLCSGVNEAIAQETGRRGRFLREGLINIVRDRWLFLRIVNHPLVASMYRDVPGKPRTPSYIPPSSLVNALLDIIVLKARQIDPGLSGRASQTLTFDQVRAATLKCKEGGYQVADAVLPLLDAAQGNLDIARKNLEAWYTSGMDRVAGWYKLHTRRALLVIGLLVAVGFNVDTLAIVTQLSRSAELRKSLADAATQVVETKRFSGVELKTTDGDIKIAQDDLKKFASGITAYEKQGLPIGFSCLSPTEVGTDSRLRAVLGKCWRSTKAMAAGDWLVKGLGWLVTGLAVSLGAPFWFDLLNRVVDLRGAGRRPESAPEPAPPTK
jgi:hypothetical protein